MQINILPQELLEQYIILRHKSDAHTDAIRHLASLVVTLEQCNTDTAQIDTAALGYVHRLIVSHCLDILEALDAFIHLADAKRRLTHGT